MDFFPHEFGNVKEMLHSNIISLDVCSPITPPPHTHLNFTPKQSASLASPWNGPGAVDGWGGVVRIPAPEKTIVGKETHTSIFKAALFTMGLLF